MQPEDPRSECSQVMNALLASGFSFQTAVTRLVTTVGRWSLLAEEFPWQDGSGDQFLDIVAWNEETIVTIECKKTQKEAFTFLQPGVQRGDIDQVRCLCLLERNEIPRGVELYFGDWRILPESFESAFCVVSTSQSGKDQRLLERDAQRLIRGTDAFGRYFRRKLGNVQANKFTPILPVIVTNAKLNVAQYDPAKISLNTGQLARDAAEISTVNLVRFRKAFTSYAGHSLEERTVFVVNAAGFQEMLGALRCPENQPQSKERASFLEK